ncbi:hypothetical protein C6Y40_03700 [Alteromonas alba]|uniref:Uncharacterized protein n=1 Tax=Alteromonas alba TaxID=2079529 RepID=A0A2S9VEM9_9ALTE|nr:hypothetical protein [Alteromonas alba]PRO74909.1 hypothetical protein C6Y40_03700 [Alteromonas alba]
MKTKLFRGYGRHLDKSVGVDLSKVSCWKGIQGEGRDSHFVGTEIVMDNGMTVLVGNSAVDVAEAVETHCNEVVEAINGNVAART